MQNWNSKIFILIPAYNSEKDISNFLPKLIKTVPSKQILVVDDASNDNTKKVCENINIDVISHKINKGKGAALRTGFDNLLKKGADWILAMDADGQHSPTDINKFLERIKINPEVGMVIGARDMTPKSMPISRIFSNTSTSFILSILVGKKILDSQSGFRIYSAKLLNSITTHYSRFQMESEIILLACSAKFDVRFVPIKTIYDSSQSHISHLKDTFRWLLAIFLVRFKLFFKSKRQ